MINYSTNIYELSQVVAFSKTKELYGGLSNMAGGFPIVLEGISIRNSEALYQAFRYPANPEVQEILLKQASPIACKIKSRGAIELTREDWMDVRVKIMYWCLRKKLEQNSSFRELLESTGNLPIVEISSRDDFWGAKKSDDQAIGQNVLGKLLDKLRAEMRGEVEVGALDITGLVLLGKELK